MTISEAARDTVLVISGSDPTAEAVLSELRRFPVRSMMIDIGDFPASATLAASTTEEGAWRGHLRSSAGCVDLERIRSVYYRRPSRFTVAEGVSPSDSAFAEYEARLGLGGVLAALDCPWVCDPVHVARAEYKPLQLVALRRAGLRVPATLITNDQEHAMRWAHQLGRPIVCKQLSPVAFEIDDEVRITYTTAIDLAAVDPAAVAATAHFLQERIVDKQFEAR